MKRRRGIFLVTVMFVSLVIAMFVSAALSLAPANLALSRNQARRQAAERAMRSGADYAIARVRSTPGGLWRAQTPQTVRLPGMIVEENQGQVVGWIQEGSLWSRFRINFNLLDGSGGLDGIADPTRPMDVSVGASINNLISNVEMPVYPYSQVGLDTSKGPRFGLAPHTILLKIEGSCGSVVLNQGEPAGFADNPTSLISESILGIRGDGTQVLDSVASAASDLNFIVGSGRVFFESQGTGGSRLRTKTGLSVVDRTGAGALLDSPQGEIRTSNNGNQVGTTVVANGITRQQENSGDAFYRISRASIPKVDAGAISLTGGVYEVNLVNNQPVVTFYEMPYADYKAARLAGTLSGGTQVTLPSEIHTSVSPTGQVKLEFTKDTTLENGTSVKELAIVPAKGAFQEGETPAAATLSPAAGTYLVSLANQIQADITGVIGSPPVSYPSPFSTSSGLAGVINAAGLGASSGSITTAGGLTLNYANSGTTLSGMTGWNQSWDGLGGTSPYGNGQYQYGALELAQYFWSQSATNPSVLRALQGYLGSLPPTDFGVGTAPNPDEQATATATSSSGLSVKDLKISLKPPEILGKFAAIGTAEMGISEQSVTIRVPGNLVLAGRLNGQGGALVAEGNLSLLGNGVDLQAGANASKVNLYSTGDILIDGFAFDNSNSAYNDVNLTGITYSWGNIRINVGKEGSAIPWGNLRLKGSMVAFGGDPESNAGSTKPSQIHLTANDLRLIFDPSSLLNLDESPVDSSSSFVYLAYHQH